MYKNNKCEYCGYPEEFSLYEGGIPGCCEEAQEEWLDANAVFSEDGDQICVLVGMDLQDGCAGFGESRQDAISDLIDNLEKKKKDDEIR